ncbi:MAG: hypothetical protein CFE44_22690, partial [Burkholderiales bacterium PBB4]
MQFLLKQAHTLRPLSLALMVVGLTACGGSDSVNSSAAVASADTSDRRATASAKSPDHYEFEATLSAPFVSDSPDAGRDFNIRMTYPGATAGQPVVWELSLLDPAGKLVQQWSGEDEYQNQAIVVNVPWAGRIGKQADLPDGNYGLQLKARAPNEVCRVLQRAPALSVSACYSHSKVAT